MGQARRDAGIPEKDYIRSPDSMDRIATIRALVRWFGPPDHRYLYVDESITLVWSQYAEHGERSVVVGLNGAITS